MHSRPQLRILCMAGRRPRLSGASSWSGMCPTSSTEAPSSHHHCRPLRTIREPLTNQHNSQHLGRHLNDTPRNLLIAIHLPTVNTLAACAAVSLQLATCSCLPSTPPYILSGNVATSPMAYTSGWLVCRLPST